MGLILFGRRGLPAPPGSGAYGSGAYGSSPYGGAAAPDVVPNVVPAIGVARAVHEVKISWDKKIGNTGWFILDSSLLNGPDLLAPASQLTPPFVGDYDDVSHLLTDATWTLAGRSATLTQVQQGKWTATLRDPDGRFNPKNASSPLHGDTDQPGRPIRHRALHNGIWRPQFYGFLRTLEYQPTSRGRGLVHIEADDLFVKLDVPAPSINPLTNTTTGAVIGACLDAIGWTDPAYRQLDTGDPIDNWPGITDASKKLLQLIADVLVTELGLFYINAAGVAVYESRNSRATKPVGYTISKSMKAIEPGMSLDTIGNKATSTKTGGTPQTYTDLAEADPIFGFGPRELPAVDSPFFHSDEAAFAHAQYRVNMKKDPVGNIWSLTIDNRTSDLLETVLALAISDRVQTDEAVTDTDFDGFAERVERTVTATPYKDAATYLLSEKGKDVFILDSSLLDGADVLAL